MSTGRWGCYFVLILVSIHRKNAILAHGAFTLRSKYVFCALSDVFHYSERLFAASRQFTLVLVTSVTMASVSAAYITEFSARGPSRWVSRPLIRSVIPRLKV